MDSIRLATISSRMQGICQRMANTLMRTGRSGVLNTAHDFSCCILSADDSFVAADESLPVHVLSGPDIMARHVKAFHPDLRRGDAFLNNSPYHGCSHPADHTILVPVIDDDGVHRFTVCAKAHQADIGNSKPTTYMATARDVYEEGALIFPGTRVQQNYEDVADIIRLCELRFRVPQQWRGDFLAMIGAARIGERELLELGAEKGWDELDAFVDEWFDYSEKRMTDAIRSMPSGKVEVTTRHDPFPGLPEDGLEIRVRMEVDAHAGFIDIDLTDNPDNLACGLNLTEATAVAGAMTGVFNSIDHTVPPNAGSIRRVNVRLREGCVVGIPRHPYSCSLGTSNICDRLENAVVHAIARLGDGWGMAECGPLLPPATGVISGTDPRNGEHYVNEIFLFHTAAGASAQADGWLTLTAMGSAGLCLLDSVELDELRFPMRVYRQEIAMDTEGPGRRRGAPGARVEFGPVDCTMSVAYASDGTLFPAAGVRGGGQAAPAYQIRCDRSGREHELDACAEVHLEAGERIVSLTQPGGGYGPPHEREPARVLEDVAEGWISTARARDTYGVVVTNDGDVDHVATQELRQRLFSVPEDNPMPVDGEDAR
ncbi:MAG: hydantoinase B/oxoprolinase family protein [Alphaproteobacteria bacterium]|nr:hydantoinase B/oxoprolinase family protein [Alphaproteobacteria bacterium]